MKKYTILSLVSVFIAIAFAYVTGCARVPVKGTPPQYIGLGEFENPTGLSVTISRSAPSPNVPVIVQAYAIDRGEYGTILKIYIEADDPNGQMAKIATTVDQVGYGHYPTDFILLKAGHERHFQGYIQWNTFSTHTLTMDEFVRMFVTVSVIDKQGHSSNEFVFPFTFETGVAAVAKPPAPFDRPDLPKLGNVAIDLFNPFHMGGGNDNDRD